ncbi:hypothetical protein CCACVL1_28153, partial [Corchorus capsularis]
MTMRCFGVVWETSIQSVIKARREEAGPLMNAKLKFQRRRRNVVNRIKTDEGVWLEDEQQIRDHTLSFYKDLFKAGELSHVDEVSEQVDSIVTPEMNE